MKHWLEAWHVIGVICWFSGLFYLPRLFVYHASSEDDISQGRFCTMEHKLFYYITLPSALFATSFGLVLWLPHYSHYAHAFWLHLKLIAVFMLWGYTLSCIYFLNLFKTKQNRFTARFYRFYNEVPTVLLIFIVIFSFVKPNV